jgi:hypothetical protein
VTWLCYVGPLRGSVTWLRYVGPLRRFVTWLRYAGSLRGSVTRVRYVAPLRGSVTRVRYVGPLRRSVTCIRYLRPLPALVTSVRYLHSLLPSVTSVRYFHLGPASGTLVTSAQAATIYRVVSCSNSAVQLSGIAAPVYTDCSVESPPDRRLRSGRRRYQVSGFPSIVPQSVRRFWTLRPLVPFGRGGGSQNGAQTAFIGTDLASDALQRLKTAHTAKKRRTALRRTEMWRAVRSGG